MSNYRHGEIWLINFEPQVETEIKKTRPGLIISRTEFNRQKQKITVLLFTTKINQSQGAARISVAKSAVNGLSKDSELITIDPVTFDKKRLIKYLGMLESELILVVKRKLFLYLDLL